nr:integrase, catalytic region, zinc finger, CCHC-type, peptidase aspartic, catalytic [Tanacetum cinerariifolium]
MDYQMWDSCGTFGKYLACDHIRSCSTSLEEEEEEEERGRSGTEGLAKTLPLRVGLAFFLGKTLPVSKPGCFLCQDCVAFCLEDLLRFVSRPLRFVSRLSCVLSQDLLCFVSKVLRFEDLFLSFEGAPQFGPKRPRVYSDLTPEEKHRYNADIWAINILLQGLPKDIYTLINHYTDAKDIWDNVKMLLEGSELTKEDRESQLYDDFEHFR